MNTEKKLDYLYIRAWGRMLGSYADYVNAQLDTARKDKAPQDAIYKSEHGWRRFTDVTSPFTQRTMKNILRDSFGTEIQ